MTTLFDGTLFADYHQFYLCDTRLDEMEPLPWSDDLVHQRLLVQPGAVSISTARNMTVPVRVQLHDAQPAIDQSQFDHIVLASIDSHGTLILAGCTDYLPDAARLAVPAGTLQLMLACSGLGAISEDGLEGEDRYDLHLWPGPPLPVTVWRQWPHTFG